MGHFPKILLCCFVLCSLTITTLCSDYLIPKNPKYFNKETNSYLDVASIAQIDAQNGSRSKRFVPKNEYFVEVAVVVDKTMSDYHKDGLTLYVYMIMHQVSLLYKREALKLSINIALKVVRTYESFSGPTDGNCINSTLRLEEFGDWKDLHVASGTFSEPDVTLLLTRDELCEGVLGKSYTNGSCTQMYNIAVVRDIGYTASAVAHEIGHSLGMYHDDSIDCQEDYTPFSEGIMYPSYTANASMWSECSDRDFYNFLSQNKGHCIENDPSKFDEYKVLMDSENFLSLNQYSLKQQCQFQNEENDDFPELDEKEDPSVCKELHCQLPPKESLKTNWADYTPCAPHALCYKSKCSLYTDFAPTDGKWSEWSSYGICSRSCGVGMEYRTRECTPPRYGGKLCKGERKEGQLCHTHECFNITQNEFRKSQCSNTESSVRCETCKIVRNISGGNRNTQKNVVDGTICAYNSSHRCFQGKCQCFNSTITSCVYISNSFQTEQDEHETIQRVMTIPAGSLNVAVQATTAAHTVHIGLEHNKKVVLPFEETIGIRGNIFQMIVDEMVINFREYDEHQWHYAEIKIEGPTIYDIDVLVKARKHGRVFVNLYYHIL